MANPRLNQHDPIHHELFDEDTAQVGSVGAIEDEHAGDAVFLGPTQDRPVGGADGGLSDFQAEMNETDPAMNESMDPDDLYSAADEQGNWATDQTGTVAGIARGFGTHLPQDLGRDGFQVEEIPDAALQYISRPVPDGELDDYDDDDDTNGKDDPGLALARASQPGVNVVAQGDREPMPHRIPIHDDRADSADDELDATRRMK